RPEKGAHVSLPVFDPIALAPRQVHVTIDAESLFVVPDSSVFDAQQSRWTGARPDTVRAWRLATDSATGASGFRGWVDAQGRLVLATQLLGMTLERRPYEVAFENWKSDAGKRSRARSRRSSRGAATATSTPSSPSHSRERRASPRASRPASRTSTESSTTTRGRRSGWSAGWRRTRRLASSPPTPRTSA